jgi:hypothetical protein
MTGIAWSLVLLLARSASGAPPAVEVPEPERPVASTPVPGPPLDLERLLRVPPGAVATPERRGGRDRATWESEFAKSRREVVELEERITDVQQKLRETVPDDWTFTPSGGGIPSDPEVLKLRATLRRDRQSLKAAQQRMRDLEVEASLAGVPESWKRREEPKRP